ncbi:MAG: winged helix-turn-helix transcriptional regulator [Polyangiaceae bacterium]|nr:winged helix-turn-helix transcriptional regulator [Myxococcales bacterium]MCB9586181.1 winged helix-turn-helix transcriptional regulator [Polyangiaceae bacterium]MCB9606858.1 winged helix-turn-helix transcriptional regulator [Polyangiaceae bacterium]
MSIKYGQICPISKAAEILGERWTLLIIRELLLGTSRFSDFQRALSQISPSLLTKRLNQLVDAELVIKKKSSEKRTEYFLTPAGRELQPLLMELGNWGSRWARGQMSDDEQDIEMLMFDFCRRIDASELPACRNVVHFVVGGVERFPRWWIIIDNDQRELCVDKPVDPVDLTVSTDVRTLSEIWAGDTPIADAKRAGRFELKGSPVLSRTISAWFRRGIFADVRPAAE